MESIISITQVVVAIALIIVILMQERSSGIGGAFGGGSEVHHARRGAEKYLLWATIALSVLFVALAIASLLL